MDIRRRPELSGPSITGSKDERIVDPFYAVVRGALLLTRAQRARRLVAERREIVGELERARRDYLRGANAPHA